ncbi:hypothetical protein NO559_09525 [Dasania sp. GY-MA-18]|uniref:Uncharacterized protein n=1 Tax=Dasania phycosphaerae TaxID=2950436 RepID=A0A9J6RLW3_9GAMM|nr:MULTISPECIES: hypothetical protein [Dasania]MCR8923013.1 hypothetical protein [Dasania sp. GY-MA-18]MCZ0865444.1 hypothetical protein [Dasania phycosphaerae]MCZ0869169.1 hypothetical protein [Dasania phycosphaerae]
MNSLWFYACLAFTLLVSCVKHQALADGLGVDKVYHPYVQPLEQEIELRFISAEPEGEASSVQQYLLAYGQSLNEQWFAEVYLVAEKLAGDNLDLEAYELELKRQLTEQGEYSADYALLFELEKQKNEDIWEFATALIVEKEWGRWSATLNAFIVSEWGDDIDDELESKLNLQARYRYSAAIEPALELYMSQDSKALGPVCMGQLRWQKQRLNWEAGLIFGLDNETPDTTFRLLLEYEF